MIIFDFIDESASGREDRSLHPGVNFGPWDFCFNSTPSVLIGPFTADPTTDTLTITAHGLVNGNQVRLEQFGTLPGGLTTGIFYFVVSATTNTFQLSLTSGGAAINITDAGTGGNNLWRRGIPFDLTGWTAWAWVKDTPQAPDTPPDLVLDLAPVIIAPTDGRVRIAVTDNASWGFAEHKNAFWDLIMSDSSGERYGLYVRGKFQIAKPVTHPAF